MSLSRNFFVLVPGPLWTAADWFLLQGMPINNASCARRRPCCCCCCCCYLEDCCSRHTGGKNHVLSFWLFGSERVLLFDMCLLSVGWFFFFFRHIAFICSVFLTFLFIPAWMYAARFSFGELCGSICFFFFFFLSTSTCQRFCAGLLAFFMTVCLLDLIHEWGFHGEDAEL